MTTEPETKTGAEADPVVARAPPPAPATTDKVARGLSGAALLVAVGSIVYTAWQTGFVTAPSSETTLVSPSPVITTRDTTLLVTVEYLSEATEESEPFDTELAVAFELAEEEPDILALMDELIALSEAGVPSLADLQRQFQDTLVASRAPVQQRILDNVTSGLNSLIVVNRSVLRREQLLEDLSAMVAMGDIAAAVETLRLEGSEGHGFGGWMRRAERRMKLDQVMSEIRKVAYLSILQGGS